MVGYLCAEVLVSYLFWFWNAEWVFLLFLIRNSLLFPVVSADWFLEEGQLNIPFLSAAKAHSPFLFIHSFLYHPSNDYVFAGSSIVYYVPAIMSFFNILSAPRSFPFIVPYLLFENTMSVTKFNAMISGLFHLAMLMNGRWQKNWADHLRLI